MSRIASSGAESEHELRMKRRRRVVTKGVKPRPALEGVASAERAMAVLKSFQQGDHALTLAEIAERTGLVKSTIMRLAISLERGGLLVRTAEGVYTLGSEILRLHSIYQASASVGSVIVPVLTDLAERTEETAAFYVLQNGQRLCQFRANSPQALRLDIAPGTYRPMDNASSAQILRLFKNWPTERMPVPEMPLYSSGATNPHTASLSAPIVGAGQRLVGALSVTGPSSRLNQERAAEITPLVLSAAAEICRALGGDPRDVGVIVPERK
jgi:DNA-binding IclR family transcriptional regulator